ncbi:nucleotide sugar dehydrogenase [Streptomyces antarcticus]|uniref:nucleotide sugar dehydrogenase n=1 Tax=Streptomyces antarcticus TaxID=2996458 RepID=UPI00227020E3|nr:MULTISPECIES: nucleotide sugar dehydrogenase [unclassified Streptomyces]MCY0944129.1 nucleotide sugar dehydrogenase [Streptomyces sp. H34-AA3]MCY0950434.1 nucleotide sugar dehydrogenase [Streptomyces sp. H27-S2]MCZ4086723.1 nucleotide sugar dehydrogenase [Streptomyces sp. H34-S5]
MESHTPFHEFDVCVVGMGYVGVTLTAALLSTGKRVLGYEANPAVASELSQGRLVLAEPGVEDLIRDRAADGTLHVTADIRGHRLPPVVIVCVGTPIKDGSTTPNLGHLTAATESIAAGIDENTLVIVRSTVPVGTSRNLVLPALRARVAEPLLAFAPERTIQGQALAELLSLPQIVGAVNESAAKLAADLFATVTDQVVPVSSLEAAELVKLVCNCHTDLIYGFGNEVALIAEKLGVDAMEVIGAANRDYPRPDIHKPGFVGGSCLTKDPYLLRHSLAGHGHVPELIGAARTLNESMPRRVGERVLAALWEAGCDPATATVLLTGFAYKGRPETDDLRGAPYEPLLELLRGRVGEIVGHDFAVPDERIAALGVRPVTIEEGFTGSHAVLILNDHLGYRDLDADDLIPRMAQPALVYDTWRVLPPSTNVMRLGVA